MDYTESCRILSTSGEFLSAECLDAPSTQISYLPRTGLFSLSQLARIAFAHRDALGIQVF
jgi:hypothetical protein